jgi:hypothetical protein
MKYNTMMCLREGEVMFKLSPASFSMDGYVQPISPTIYIAPESLPHASVAGKQKATVRAMLNSGEMQRYSVIPR